MTTVESGPPGGALTERKERANHQEWKLDMVTTSWCGFCEAEERFGLCGPLREVTEAMREHRDVVHGGKRKVPKRQKNAIGAWTRDPNRVRAAPFTINEERETRKRDDAYSERRAGRARTAPPARRRPPASAPPHPAPVELRAAPSCSTAGVAAMVPSGPPPGKGRPPKTPGGRPEPRGFGRWTPELIDRAIEMYEVMAPMKSAKACNEALAVEAGYPAANKTSYTMLTAAFANRGVKLTRGGARFRDGVAIRPGPPKGYHSEKMAQSYLAFERMEAVHDLLRVDVTVGQIAELAWKLWGYANRVACKVILNERLRRDGFPMPRDHPPYLLAEVTRSEARLLLATAERRMREREESERGGE